MKIRSKGLELMIKLKKLKEKKLKKKIKEKINKFVYLFENNF